jgi:hypothetical protein
LNIVRGERTYGVTVHIHSPWGSPRARLGECEIGVVKARLSASCRDCTLEAMRTQASSNLLALFK